jgi:hypothetical protein
MGEAVLKIEAKTELTKRTIFTAILPVERDEKWRKN